MLQPLSSTNRIAIVRLAPDQLTAIETSVLARWVIAPRLLGVQGVANVAIFGQRDRQLQVLVDPETLESAGVSLGQVVSTAGNALEVSPLTYLEASKPGTGGFIDTFNQRFQVFHEQAIETPEQLEQVPLEDEDGASLLVDGEQVILGDVTEVVEGHQPLIGDALCARSECQLLVIEKFPNANTVAVAEGLEEALDVMRPGLGGLAIDATIFRPADYVESAVSNQQFAILLGIGLALLAVAAFMLKWRSVLVVAVALGVSVGAAVLVLSLLGQTLNLMVLGGLILGLVVVIDDAIIDVNGLTSRLRVEDGTNRMPIARKVKLALIEPRSAVIYAALLVTAAVVPFFFMDGVARAFAPPMLASFLLVVAVSLIVAVTVTAALGSVLLAGGEIPPISRLVTSFYDRRLARYVTRTTPAVLATAVAIVLGIVAANAMSTSLDPDLREQDLVVELTAEPGTSLIQMSELTGEVVQSLAALPGVRDVGAHVGRAITSDQISNVNEAEVWIHIDPAQPYDETLGAVEEIAGANSQLDASVTTHSQQRIDEFVGGTSDDIVVRVYGENAEILEQKALEVEAELATVDGIEDLHVDYPATEQTLRITTDLVPAQAVGLAPGDIRRQSAILMNGITVGNLFDEQKIFDVVVWGLPALRADLDAVRNLPIETDGFGWVPLGSVAAVEEVLSPAKIRHESVFNYLDVVAQVAGRPLGDVASDVDEIVDQLEFPLEHHAELLGDSQIESRGGPSSCRSGPARCWSAYFSSKPP